ncbi:MAG: xanthine dehydrogenase accessory protein XdhC [Rhodobacteraceae bacterium]|nr:xanthine dehydrogenase accessory protein XdhC [Paracoccaceae bacterium]
MSIDLDALCRQLRRHDRVARIVITATEGSSPREAGASMLVWNGGQEGSIGGGALEYECVAAARERLSGASPHADYARRSLGPGLGQCCGGSVTLVTEIFDRNAVARLSETQALFIRPLQHGAGCAPDGLRETKSEVAIADGWIVEPVARPGRHIWIYGAGHVGRAIVSVLAPLPGFQIVWVDVGLERYPDREWPNVRKLPAVNPADTVGLAEPDSEHLIMTYSHGFDQEICNRILASRFRSAGLIGSATKWKRFRRRLIDAGHKPDAVDRIECPIGDSSLGKHPQAIAVGVVSRLLQRHAE